MSELITQKRDEDITTIMINRGDTGNRVTDEMAGQLADMISNASKDSRLILFKGAGQEFCLGRDEVKKK
ncbi:MAG: hypothetical protein JRJ65_18230, partial [Deltaproteobacteria bacterium]|nr:hypothetical protein [Deltaproteobacteria bacterium]